MMQIAVISGKGGTGKSSVSAAFATAGSEVVVADCDVDAANLYLLFSPVIEEEEVYIAGHKAVIDYTKCTECGKCIDYCNFDAISFQNNRVVIDEISCDGCFFCSRICPENAISMVPNDKSKLYSGSFRNGKMVYGRLAPGEENSGKLVNLVRDRAKNVSETNLLDTIIIDGPPGIGCPVISTITGVDKVVIVTEPGISGLSDMERAISMVIKSERIPYVIINKWDLNPEMTNRIKDHCHNINIPVAGLLPFDRKMVEAMVNGQTIIEYDPDCEASHELRRIWKRIENSDINE